MATDAVLLEQVGAVVVLVESVERTLVQLAPIPPGRSYVISAKGNVLASNAVATLTLEAFGAKDSVVIGFGAGQQGQVSFSLVVGVALPPDDELFTVAKVTGSGRAMGGTHSGSAMVDGVKLLVLAVDSLSVSQVSS